MIPSQDQKSSYSSTAPIAAIADVIANFHDWPVGDLSKEGAKIIQESFPDLDPEFVSRVLNSFIAIDPRTRFSSSFNHENFVAEQYRSFFGNA